MDDLTKQGMTSSSNPEPMSTSKDNQNGESAPAPAQDKDAAPPKETKKYSSDEESDEEDTRDMEGRMTTKQGEEVSRIFVLSSSLHRSSIIEFVNAI